MMLLSAVTILSLTSFALAGGRVEVSLNGTWEYQRAEELDSPPAGGPWKAFEVPGYLSGFDYQRAWFRRSFDVPGAMRGKRINLLMTASWPPRGQMSRDEIREQWEAVKRAGCVAFRTHTQPWRRMHYEVADEVGLLVVVEGAVWNDDTVYRVFDPAFWDNYGAHLAAMVRRDKNHPSVVMWSLENEFYGSRLNDDSPAKADLVRMGELVKREDPTRPITFSSDGDPGGVADVIGLHYPHEYPRFTCWPNEALWLATPQPIQHPLFGDGLLDEEGNFFWRKHKPLYIGEFLWLPCFDPSWHTVFFGDEAYRNYPEYRNRGKAEAWKMQIIGYRHHEVAGISPRPTGTGCWRWGCGWTTCPHHRTKPTSRRMVCSSCAAAFPIRRPSRPCSTAAGGCWCIARRRTILHGLPPCSAPILCSCRMAAA